jgi:HK97 family phage prohead protease
MKRFYQLTNKSFSNEKVKTHKELWEKVKGEHEGFSACVATEFKQKAEDENKFSVVMSTAKEDRHGDIVKQEWDLKSFKKNPVFLDSHNYDSIEHIIGKVKKIAVKDNKLIGEIEFMRDNPKGELAYNMAKKGFLNATSVGFIPKEFSDKGEILKSELLEDSAVSVPANAEALFEKCQECEEKEEEKKEEKDEEVDLEVEKTLEPSKAERINKYLKKKEEKKKEILKESLAVIQRLQKRKVDSQKKRQMVNRVIKQLIKIK